ncbi:MAG TPA: hypothetical protein VJX92_29090, partial [Methylomirabilota bacterium]|nr:hypothetical protein [Methylomirabilota bacterium]
MFAGFVLAVLLSMVALVVSLVALLASRTRPGSRGADERVATLEEQVRGLLYRVWTLEGTPGGASPAPAPSPAAPDPSPPV